MLSLLLGCAHDAVPIDEVTNRWWHFRDQDFNLYLQRLEDQPSGDLWLDETFPDDPVEANDWGGQWTEVDARRFEVDYDGSTYVVHASPSEDEVGCYDVAFGILARDLACPL